MVVPSKENYNLLLGREWIHGVRVVPSTLHQVVSIWRDDGIVENIEADHSYFVADVSYVGKHNFERSLAHIAPYDALDNELSNKANVNYSMRLDPHYGFMWRQEFSKEDSDDNDITPPAMRWYEVDDDDV